MNPWTFIGWVVIALLSFPVVLWILSKVARMCLYLGSRNVPPKAGQIWMQNGRRLYVKEIYEGGRVCVTTQPPNLPRIGVSSSWTDTPTQWKARVRYRRCYIVKN